MWIYVKRLSLFFNFPIREDKNTVWAPQRQSPGCDRVWFKGPPASRWAVRPYVWRVRCLRTHAVPRQLRPLLVCGPKWTGDPWDSLGAWKKTNVWVNQCTQNQTLHEQWSNTNRATWKRHRRDIFTDRKGFSLSGINHGVVPPPVGPTTRPNVYPLPPGTHLLFSQNGRIDHIPLEGYHMKKDDARAVLHLPVSFYSWDTFYFGCDMFNMF